MRLLYVESSPRKERSHSIKLAKAFLKAFREKHPDCEIDTLDLWSEELPSFDGDTITAKYTILHGKSPTGAQEKAWNEVKAVATRFATADKFVFSIPMWNYHIPYKLKHYIDVITQPGITFSFSPETGYQGLVTGKPVLSFYASGGSYRPGTETEKFDHQKPYMRLWLNFIGLTDIREIVDDGTLSKEECEKKILEECESIVEYF